MTQTTSSPSPRPRKRTLAHWKRQIERRPCAALLVDRQLVVVAANAHSRDSGIAAGQALHEWMPRIAPPPDEPGGFGVATRLDWHRVRTEDFAGCLVEILPDAASGGARETHTLERRLAEAKRRLQNEIRHRQFLERQILTIADAEKRRISMDLHDELGQHLTGIAFRARALEDSLRGAGHPAAADCGQLVALVNEGIGKTRALSRGLWPLTLQGGSLAEALGCLAKDLEAVHGVECRIDVPSTQSIDAGVDAHHLFRIIQEAATNAIKHGRARRLSIHFERLDEQLVVTVRNDGEAAAAQPADEARGGIGMVGMKLRAELLGGQMAFESGADGGTAVRIAIPERRVREPEELRS